MTADDLIALNEQIAGMARAGLPLDQGLAGLAREMARGRLRRVTESLVADLRAGATLPEALDRRRDELPPYYAQLVAAGVRTGRLPDVLTTMSAYARTVAATRTTVIDALLYPAVVLAFGFAMFVLIAVLVLPQFDQIFKEFGLKLPYLTECVLAFGRDPEWLIGLPVAAVTGGTAAAWALMRLTPRGRRRWAAMIYTIPLIGALVRAARLAAFAELLAVLVEYELPLPDAFRFAGASSPDPVMAADAVAAADRLTEGQSLGDAVRGKGLVPEWVVWMAGTAERQGALGPTLRQVAAVYQRQVEARAGVLRTVLPPVVILVTAGFMAVVFGVAVLLPMMALLRGLGN